MATLHNTKVDLSGLLEVLGKNLYSTPSVAIRELIQNAHDACIRHTIESSSHHEHRIDIHTDDVNSILTIKDNGSGLTKSEVESFLATIGSGYTRILRNQSQTEDMIGYFGLGFLSAYVVADKVEVITTSYQSPDETWQFTSNGGHRFSITKTAHTQRGSSIHLHCKTEYKHLASASVITQLIQKYCCLLPIGIYINDSSTPINAMKYPSLKELSKIAYKKQSLEFAQLFEHNFDPVCTFPILSNELNVEGIIWIQDGGAYSSSDNRNVNIFVRNMFITREHTELLPRWAGFCGCVINTPSLTPTASRESIQTNEQYEAVQKLIKQSLIQGLISLISNEPENWRRVLRRHNQGLLGAAICENDLFEKIKTSLKLPTNQGELTVSSILEKSNGQLIIQPEEQNGYQSLLFKAQIIPVISGYYYGVGAYCQKYIECSPSIKKLTLGSKVDEKHIFKPITVGKSIKDLLIDNFKSNQEDIIFTQFKPHYIPLVISENHDAKLKKRLDNDEADKRIGNAILSLARKTLTDTTTTSERTLYINMASPMITRLIKLEPSQQVKFSKIIRVFTNTLTQEDEKKDFADDIQTFFNQILDLMDI